MPEVVVKFNTVQEAHAVTNKLGEGGAQLSRCSSRATKTIRVQKYASYFVVHYNYINSYQRRVTPIKILLKQLGIQ